MRPELGEIQKVSLHGTRLSHAQSSAALSGWPTHRHAQALPPSLSSSSSPPPSVQSVGQASCGATPSRAQLALRQRLRCSSSTP